VLLSEEQYRDQARVWAGYVGKAAVEPQAARLYQNVYTELGGIVADLLLAALVGPLRRHAIAIVRKRDEERARSAERSQRGAFTWWFCRTWLSHATTWVKVHTPERRFRSARRQLRSARARISSTASSRMRVRPVPMRACLLSPSLTMRQAVARDTSRFAGCLGDGQKAFHVQNVPSRLSGRPSGG
jgi:hypothetical protein